MTIVPKTIGLTLKEIQLQGVRGPTACPACRGQGYHENGHSFLEGALYAMCMNCKGTGIRPKPIATWDLQLNVRCPSCLHLVNLAESESDPEFWYHIEAGEEREDFETTCPDCGHEFNCKVVY